MRLCVTHGMVEGERCPRCDAVTLDPDAPENAKVVAASLGIKATAGGKWMELAVGLVMFVGVPLLGYTFYKSERVGTYLVYGLALCLGAYITYAVARLRANAPAGSRSPLFTSTTILAFLLCLVFVGIREAVGIEALWYARGMAPWRIITSALTHGGLLHIAGNMAFLILFGLAVEARIGRLNTAAVLLASALAGTLVQAHYSAEPMVGFSGAVYGIFGATLAVMPTSPQLLRIRGGAVVPLPTWAWMLVFVPAYTLIAAMDKTSHVGWVAHLAGFFAGLAVALPMRRMKPSEAFLSKERAKREQIASAVQHDGSGLGTEALDAEPDASPAVSDPAIRAYLDDARRHRQRVSVIGGGVMLALGLGMTLIIASLDAPPGQGARKAESMVAGLVMAVSGLLMLMQAVRNRRR